MTEVALAGMVALTLVVLTVVLWGSARSLDRAHTARELAQADLRQTEAALQQRDRRERAILASIGYAVVTTNTEGALVSINPAMERLAGWSESEVRGRPYSDVYVLLDRRGNPIPPEGRFLSRAVASRSTVATKGFDVTLVARDGRRIPIGVTAAPIFDYDGRLIGGVDVIRDVSEQREVDHLKSSLVSTVSHELRTPLTMIQGFAELTLARELPREQRVQAAEQIHAAARRLARLIDNLLSVSRMEAGRIEAHPEPLDPADVVREVVRSFGPGRAIRFSSSGEVPRINADREMVIQILTNLVSNAVKYSPQGAPVSVRLQARGDMVEVSVTDRGIGMTPHELARLFDKFFRSDRPEVRRISGSSLGLFITRNLVDLQGGRIEVDSEPGAGTSVRVALPLADAPRHGGAPRGGPAPAPARSGGGEGGTVKKLLIADDEEGVRSLVRMTLEVDSFDILEAADGHEALAVARRHRPELVLLDVAMPGLSGFEVCRTLKTDPATASITVIMLTAKAQDSERQEGLAVGADDYFTKPFSPLLLMTKVDEVFADGGSP